MDDLDQRLQRFLCREVRVGQGVYIAKGAVVLGDVTLGDRASVWYNAVLRGDINRIVVGTETNIQDNVVVHLADDHPCLIGERVTVGHGAVVHACTIEHEVLIGMGSIVLDGAVVGAESIVGAGAVVAPGAQIPAGSLVKGVPGRVVRALSGDERRRIRHWAEKYVANARFCLDRGLNVGGPSLVCSSAPDG